MIPKACKRLAEVDFSLSAVNDACVKENNRKTRVESGHPSLLHSWWARRPWRPLANPNGYRGLAL